ncbi:MAG: hypothetical protein HRF51_06240 [bacterium]|jgi:hypothetical protein
MSIKSIFIFGLLLFTPTIGPGTMIEVPSKAIDFECSVTPTPEYGQLFTVRVSFSLKDKTDYLDTPGAGCQAKLVTFPKQEYVSGDTILSGRFRQGETQTLSATYRAVNPGRFHTALILKIRGEADSLPREKMGGYSHTTGDCGYYYIEDPNPSPKSIVLDSATGLTVTTLADSLLSGVPKPAVPFTLEVNRTGRVDKRDPDPRMRIDKEKIQGEKLHRRPPPFIVHLRRLEDGSNGQVDDIRLVGRRRCEVIFRAEESGAILRPEFADSVMDVWGMHTASDSTLFLTPPIDTSEATIEGTLEGRPLILRVERVVRGD